MTEVAYGSLPPEKAIAHFRSKLNIATLHWDDLMRDAHAKAFTIAGVTQLALLADMRAAVDQALAEGQSFHTFKKQFKTIVEKHGWQHRGSSAWRAKLIYNTNMRTATMAGRWEQMQRTKESRPYLQYMTVGDRRVRNEHRRWDKLILPIDDPFWDTHYPPNGWGCRCTVRSLSERDLTRKGLSVSNTPDIKWTERINTRSGEVYGDVPEGIDTGWNYNVGKAWLAPETELGQLLVQQPPFIQNQFNHYLKLLSKRLQSAFEPWLKRVLKREYPVRHQVCVGYMRSEVMQFIANKDVELATATITLDQKQLLHLTRDQKGERVIPMETIEALPSLIYQPIAVLWEKETENLLYVVGQQEERAEKFFIQVNFKRKGEVTNSIRSGGLVPLHSLHNLGKYELIWGTLEAV